MISMKQYLHTLCLATLSTLLGGCHGGSTANSSQSSVGSSSSSSISSSSSSSSSSTSSSSSSSMSSSSSVSSSSSSVSSSSSSSASSNGQLGLDARPANATCVAGAPPGSNDSITLDRVYSGVSLAQPVALLQAPRDSSRWFVVQQTGAVMVFNNVANVSATTTFINITSEVTSGGEMGLLGMAFHPNFPTDPRVYLSYTATESGQLVSRVAEFQTSDGGLTLNAASEKNILTINQPFSNHNGGNVMFGPDGYMYLGYGDGGSGGDPNNNGQSTNTLLGKMLRIDINNVTAPSAYNIPASNPFAGNARCGRTGGSASCPEIFAWGLRNPWRWSFDRATSDLWVGDVGQNAYEEVDKVVVGGNYGWRCREGLHDYNTSGCGGGYIDPLVEYDHSLGAAVTGGYVYRGTQTTNFVGRYLFADYGSGRIWVYAPGLSPARTELIDSNYNISSFGEDVNGELYVLDYAGGGVYHIRFQSTSTGGTVPDNLINTGCVSNSDPTQPASGLIPYSINAPFWSDGAVKDRWLALPDGQTVSVGTTGHWDFPNGSVLMKNFRINNQLIETRLLMHHTDGSWAGYTYEWNDAQTAATRVHGGKTRTVNGQQWIYPAESQCLDCHTAVAGRSLGPTTAQLNRNHIYASTNRTANELDTLSGIGVTSTTINSSTAPMLTDPTDTTATLDNRARAYLQSNCAQCHQPGGPAPVNIDFKYTTALSSTNTCNVLPSAGTLGLANPHIITPSSASTSVLVSRVNRRDANAMPPLGSNIVDANGVMLLTNWINSLTGCL